MPDRFKAVAFGVDAASLLSLQEALPEWQIEVLHGVTAASLTHDWNAGEADLLVVAVGAEVAETFRLCRFLVLCSAFLTDAREPVTEALSVHRGRQTRARGADAPLLVLVPSG